MYYLVIWIILAISAMYNYARNDNYARMLAIVCYLVLVFTSGLRYETGTDYLAYAKMYEELPALSDLSLADTYVEPFYAILCSFFITLGCDINIMFLFISIIITAILFVSFKRYVGQKYYLFAVILYYGITYFMLDMSGIRQAIAFSLFLYSIRFIIDKKPYKYILIIALAFCFHRSAAVLIIVYPIVRLHIKSWIHYLIFGVGLAVIVLKIGWLKGVLEFSTSIFVSGPMAGKVSSFLSNEFFSVPRTITPGLLIYLPIYLIAVWRRKDLEKLIPDFNTILNLFLLYIVTLFYLYESYDISVRFGAYFSIAFVLTFPLMLDLLRQDKPNLTIGFTAILFVSIFAMRYAIIGNEPTTIMLRPYQNYVMYKMGLVDSDAQERYDQLGSQN